MIEWVEISYSTSEESKMRFDFLSQYLNEINKKNKIHYVNTTPENLWETISQCKKKYDQIRFSEDVATQIIAESTQLPSEIVNIAGTDALFQKEGKWWFKMFLYDAFHDVISKKGMSLDLESALLVVGTSVYASVLTSGFIKTGFDEVNISSTEDDKGKAFVEKIKKKYFGVNVNYVPQSRLVTLPGIHGVVVNTVQIKDNEELVHELSYYNFLQKEGVVVDCNLFPVESELTKEAKEVGAYLIQGYELLSLADLFWAQMVFKGTLDSDAYIHKFYQHFK